ALALFGAGLDRYGREQGVEVGRLRPAADRAAAEVVAFRRFLTEELREGGSYGCGDEALSLLIRRGHWLEEDADQILSFAEHQADELTAYLEAHAADFGARTWQEAVAGLQQLHPTVEQYLPRCEQIWDDSRQAAID